ncbi:hypothetical protein LBMAG42_42910 [Deltaproteobacteria bacterium]|nr:hypothetical protein LBMAG42_42910 [Deltaproteobacteria bacterium]
MTPAREDSQTGGPTGSRLRVAFRALRIALALPWLAFTAWLFVYGMPLSGIHACLGVWVLWPSKPSKPASAARPWARRFAALAILSASVATVPLVGLPEYATTTNRLHCRTLGFTGARAPGDCDAAEVARGKHIAAENGRLFSTRERLGVHGFNLVLATGGYLVGFPEVADETALMSFVADPLPAGASVAQRRAQCRASYGDSPSKLAVLGAPRTIHSDFPMRTSRVRGAVAKGVARLGKAEGSTLDLGEVHFVSGHTDLDAYSGALLGHSLRVALALEVGDSRLALKRGANATIDVTWTGTIHYPGDDIAFAAPLPLPWSPPMLRVSETVFCGMQIDGAMNPFVLTHTWTLEADDPRIHAEVDESERGLGERLALAVVGLAGMVLGGG